MIEICAEYYALIAEQLRDAIGEDNYFNGSINVEFGSFVARLTTTLLVYWEDIDFPEGRRRTIGNIVPIWWECATYDHAGGEVLNDFDFNEMLKSIAND